MVREEIYTNTKVQIIIFCELTLLEYPNRLLEMEWSWREGFLV